MVYYLGKGRKSFGNYSCLFEYQNEDIGYI